MLLCFHLPRSAQCGGKTTVKHKRPPTSDGVSGGKHFLKFGKESLLVLLSLRPIPACVSASRGPATWTQTAKGCSQRHLPAGPGGSFGQGMARRKQLLVLLPRVQGCTWQRATGLVPLQWKHWRAWIPGVEKPTMSSGAELLPSPLPSPPTGKGILVLHN